MANKFSEELFEAIDVILGKRLESVDKDKTILCVVEDNKNAADGEYTVSNASAKFTAYSENPKYSIGQNVWVLVPAGDFNNDKLIVSKYTRDSNAPFIYVDPTESFANITGNVLGSSLHNFVDDTPGLVANYSVPRNIFTGEPITGTVDGTTVNIHQENVAESLRTSVEASTGNLRKVVGNNEELVPIDLAGYNRICVSADFKTAFGSNEPINGSYGLFFIVTVRKEKTPTKQNTPATYEYSYLTMIFDSSDMWGNPYNYGEFFRQSICFDINPEEQGTPVGIDGYFYQNFDFNDGEYPFGYTDANGNELISDPNIFVQNISMSFGYAVDKVENDSIFLFTTDNTTYIVDNDDYDDKTLQARFIYVGDDETRFAVNNMNELTDHLKTVAETGGSSDPLISLMPFIRWYRYSLKQGVTDPRAGDFWEEIFPNQQLHLDKKHSDRVVNDLFTIAVNNLTGSPDERFLALLCYNNKFTYYLRSYLMALQKENSGYAQLPQYIYWNRVWHWAYCVLNGWDSVPAVNTADREKFDKQFPYNTNAAKPVTSEDHLSSNEILQQWASSDQIIRPASPLILRNQDDTWDTNRDLIQALQMTPADPSKGVFNLYEATLGSNSMLINLHDANVTRSMKLNFKSAVTGEEELDTAERICWFVPKNNTMIQPPAQDKLREGQTLITNRSDLTNIFTEQEWDIYEKYQDDYYLILDISIVDPEAKEKTQEMRNVEAFLDYYIKPNFLKRCTNNKIRASAYRYKRTYETEYDLQFGAKGTNGTGYTLFLNMLSETAHNNAVFTSPVAWTVTDNPTTSMVLDAELYDADENLVTDCSYTWSVYSPSGATINGLSNVKSPTITSMNTHGVILKCTVTLTGGSAEFYGYLAIPTRNRRFMLDIEGPTSVRYDSNGLNPAFYEKAYGVYQIVANQEVFYDYNSGTKNIEIRNLVSGSDGGAVIATTDKWYPTLIKGKEDSKYHLKPKAMYFNNVEYNLYIRFHDSDSKDTWSQPLLVVIDPYGNSFLNNWGGELNIDHENNTIMSAVMGAGKKEADNTFTGILMGDLPHVDSSGLTEAEKANRNNWQTHSGMVGYEHGEEYYQLYDNGTIALGKPSRAQLKFNGTEGLIQNAGYDYGHGIKIDFDGGIDTTSGHKNKVTSAASNDQHPYIDIKDTNGAQIYLSTDGTEASPYLKIKSPNATGGKDLLHIESTSYYLQTENYKDATSSTAGAGLKIDLANGILNSYDKLTINGASGSKIHFGGDSSYLELGYDGTKGYLNSTGVLSMMGGGIKDSGTTITRENTSYKVYIPDSNSPFVYLSNNTTAANDVVKNLTGDTTTKWIKVGNETHTDWKFIIGENFGIESNGAMVASAGNIGGWMINSTNIRSADSTYTNSKGMILQPEAGEYSLAIGASNSGDHGSAPFWVKHTGELKAIKGKIGGWNLSSENLYTGSGNDAGSVNLSTVDFTRTINGTERSNLRFAIGSKFAVKNDGTIYAAGGRFSGTISGSSISGSTLTAGNIEISSSKITVGDSTITFRSTSPAAVLIGGNLAADNIYASSGTVKGNWLETNQGIYLGNRTGGGGMYITNAAQVLYAGTNASTADAYIVRSNIISMIYQKQSSTYNIYADEGGLYYNSNGKHYIHLHIDTVGFVSVES